MAYESYPGRAVSMDAFGSLGQIMAGVFLTFHDFDE